MNSRTVIVTVSTLAALVTLIAAVAASTAFFKSLADSYSEHWGGESVRASTQVVAAAFRSEDSLDEDGNPVTIRSTWEVGVTQIERRSVGHYIFTFDVPFARHPDGRGKYSATASNTDGFTYINSNFPDRVTVLSYNKNGELIDCEIFLQVIGETAR
jgi:hypothetical protein